jgi:transaldolase
METNNVKSIHALGQSIWLDFIDREIMTSGKLQKFIDEDGVRGITSNPAIFEKAISSSNDYDEDISKNDQQQLSNEEVFYSLAIKDIQKAADLFKQVYEEDIPGADGYVSLEVSPHLAQDTLGTIEQAEKLWHAVNRKNVMIKIPGTAECLPAITHCISKGININVTLLFGLKRYEEVANAYITGLEDRIAQNLPVNHIASVASFFLSRIDAKTDPLLKEKGLDTLKGKVAIASAKIAYETYKRIFNSDRFKKLMIKGAKPQKVLWASTSSKDPSFKDTKYVEALIGPDTVNTIPLETLDAFRDHGVVENQLEQGLDESHDILRQLQEAGINLGQISQELEEEGIDKFNKPYNQLLETIGRQRGKSAE